MGSDLIITRNTTIFANTECIVYKYDGPYENHYAIYSPLKTTLGRTYYILHPLASGTCSQTLPIVYREEVKKIVGHEVRIMKPTALPDMTTVILDELVREYRDWHQAIIAIRPIGTKSNGTLSFVKNSVRMVLYSWKKRDNPSGRQDNPCDDDSDDDDEYVIPVGNYITVGCDGNINTTKINVFSYMHV